MKSPQERFWDPFAVCLLLGAVLLSAWRLQVAGWAEGLRISQSMALIGGGLGLALGYSRFERRGLGLLIPAYTLVVSTWLSLGIIPFDPGQTYLGERLQILAGRFVTDWNILRAGDKLEDQFFVVALLCLPIWFASIYSGYQLTRRANFLRVILPNGVLIFIFHAYHYTSKDYSWMLGAYLFLALLLMGRLKFLEERKRRAQGRVQVSSESGFDLTNTTITVAAALILLAWAIPYILPPTAQGREFWRNTYGRIFPPERFDNLFASVEKEGRPAPRNFQTELALGAHTTQSDRTLFRVFIPDSASELPRLYWRGQVYARYEGGQWHTIGGQEIRRAPADGDLEIPDSGHSRRYGFTFDILADGLTTLYMPAQPVWANHDAIVLYSEAPSAEAEGEPLFDVMAMRAFPALKAGDLYRASALIANPNQSDLREAGENYPVWVLETYLQLPGDFSPRIRELALQITAPYDNSFDKALAVTNYLRDEIEYADFVSVPMGAVDPLEYVLFQSKKGFCNYYASAEVLMLRAAGIPARLAVGYAQGEPNLQNSIYVVRERDLHAWPEVYFPEYGWVEFEPTGNQDPLQRPERSDATEGPNPAANPVLPLPQLPLEEEEKDRESRDPLALEDEQMREEQAARQRQALFTALVWLGGTATFLMSIVLKRRFAPQMTTAAILKRAVERSGLPPPRWLDAWAAFAELPVIERWFHSVNIGLQWMKRPQAVHVTAAERAWILKHILPDASDSIESLLREHQSQLFTPLAGDPVAARRASLTVLYRAAQKRLKMLILGYNYAELQDTPRYPL